MNTVTRIRPSTITNQPASIPIQSVISAGPTLKSRSANPIAIANAKISCPRGGSGRLAGELRAPVEEPERLLELVLRHQHRGDAAVATDVDGVPPGERRV